MVRVNRKAGTAAKAHPPCWPRTLFQFIRKTDEDITLGSEHLGTLNTKPVSIGYDVSPGLAVGFETDPELHIQPVSLKMNVPAFFAQEEHTRMGIRPLTKKSDEYLPLVDRVLPNLALCSVPMLEKLE